MTKREAYRAALRALSDWDAYLLEHSSLPGPRANLELLHAAADDGDEARFRHLLSFDAVGHPTNTPGEFLAACGATGFGKLLAEGQTHLLPDLRILAADPRWRVREGVAMALQRWGAADMDALLAAMTEWAAGTFLEQRAVVAGLCEPALLRREPAAAAVLAILDTITARLAAVPAPARKDEGFGVLRQALAYGWSVAAVALPAAGLPLMERWLASSDRDVRWLMRENLKKDRLAHVAPDWTARWRQAIA